MTSGFPFPLLQLVRGRTGFLLKGKLRLIVCLIIRISGVVSNLPNAYLSIQALKAGAFSRLTTTLSSGHPTRCSTSFELK